MSSGKKKLVKLDSMSDVERALSDSKDSASAVSSLYGTFQRIFRKQSFSFILFFSLADVYSG